VLFKLFGVEELNLVAAGYTGGRALWWFVCGGIKENASHHTQTLFKYARFRQPPRRTNKQTNVRAFPVFLTKYIKIAIMLVNFCDQYFDLLE